MATNPTRPTPGGIFSLGQPGRPNLFDGRLLNATTLRQGQSGWTTAMNLASQDLPAGILWGFGVEAPGIYQVQVSSDSWYGGLSASTASLMIRRGGARTSDGRTVHLASDLLLTLEQLMTEYTASPRSMSNAPMSPGAGPVIQTSSKPASEGSFLLLATAGEVQDGTASKAGQACTPGDLCGVDGLRAGVSFSLAYVEPLSQKQLSVLTLRNELTSRYFDRLEQRGTDRWKTTLLRSEPAPAPVSGDVPLALLVVGKDGSLLTCDPWVARRPIQGSSTASWFDAVRGAPIAPLRLARLAQFQNQLLDALGETAAKLTPSTIPSLRGLGFRVVPPFGFLPLPAGGDPASWFKNTNVASSIATAVHDDAILPEIAAAIDADPLVLQSSSPTAQGTGASNLLEYRDWLADHAGQADGAPDLVDREGYTRLDPWLKELYDRKIDLDDLARRNRNPVRLYVLREGTRRIWPDGVDRNPKVSAGPGWLNRSIVLYVRQRVVLPRPYTNPPV